MTAIDDITKDHARRINRCAEVEQILLDIARGKRELPTREECRKFALRIGDAETESLRRATTYEAEDAAKVPDRWEDPTGFDADQVRDEAENWTRRETGKQMLLNYAAMLAAAPEYKENE